MYRYMFLYFFEALLLSFSSESEITVRKDTNTKHQESPDNTDHWKCSICYDKLITVKEYNEHIKYHLEEIEELDIECL